MTTAPVTQVIRAAYDQLVPELAAMSVVGLTPFNLDTVYAVGVVRGIVPRLAPYREALASLPGPNLQHLERLALYGNALAYIQNTLDARAQRVRELPELAQEGFKLRALMMAYVELLALRGVVTTEQVERLREGSGYRDLIADLGALVQILTRDGSLLKEGAPVTLAEVQRASDLAFAMNTAHGTDMDLAKSHAEMLVERQKIAHLLDLSHRELRRCMAFLRFHEGDAAELVPSLRVGGRPRKAGSEPAAEPSFGDQHEQAHAGFAHPDDNPFTTES